MSCRNSTSDSTYDWADWFKSMGVVILIGLIIALIGFWIFWAGWMHFVDRHEQGFCFNRFTGEIELFNRTGYFCRAPIKYSIHAIDTRPYQVSISANQRILNAKLIRFNSEGLITFVQWHGRDAGDSLHGLLEILKCYAFDRQEGRDCPFLTIVSEIAPDQGFDSFTNSIQIIRHEEN